MHTYVIALDQGTTSSRAVLFDENARIVAMKSYEFEQIYPQPGWVEHDPAAILNTQVDALREVVRISGVPLDSIAAIGITMVAGCSLRFLRIEPGRLDRRQALAVTGFAWVVLALFASFPLYFSGHYMTYLDAVFDGVSGLTTTGASLIVDLDHLSYADNMFRFAMHALGGLGLIVVALSFGLFGRGGGASLFSSEGRSEHVVPNVVQTTQFMDAMFAVDPRPPAWKASFETAAADPIIKAFGEYGQQGIPMPSIPQMSNVFEDWGLAEFQVAGGADPTTTMQNAATSINQRNASLN